MKYGKRRCIHKKKHTYTYSMDKEAREEAKQIEMGKERNVRFDITIANKKTKQKKAVLEQIGVRKKKKKQQQQNTNHLF